MLKDLTKEHPVLFVGGAIALVFLLVFMGLQQAEASAMDLEIHWVALAALPLVAALIVGKYVTGVDAFGLKFESAISEQAEPEKFDDPAAITVDGDSEKGRITALSRLGETEKLEKRQLKFRAGPNGRYVAQAVKKYLMELPRLESLLVLGKSGSFIGKLQLAPLREQGNPSLSAIRNFIDLLEKDDPAGFRSEYGTDFSSASLPVKTSVADAYEYCAQNNLDSVPAVDSHGLYKGVFSRDKLAIAIANKAIAARKG